MFVYTRETHYFREEQGWFFIHKEKTSIVEKTLYVLDIHMNIVS